jgi:GNAT superfamily N-acetyltransferase
MQNGNFEIAAFGDLNGEDRERQLAEIRRIFFATAGRSLFPSKSAREDYWRRWCGIYLELWPGFCLLALSEDGLASGYLAGCPDTFSREAAPAVANISYYTPGVLAGVRGWPAHLHINMAPGDQGQGGGHALVNAFLAACRKDRVPGVHVVTGRNAAAGCFYLACGFALKRDFAPLNPALSLYAMSL